MDFWFLSISSFTSIIVIVNLKLYSTERFFNWINFLGFLGLSMALYVIVQWISNYLDIFVAYKTVLMVYQSPTYYFTVILCVLFVYVFDQGVIRVNVYRNRLEQFRILKGFPFPQNDMPDQGILSLEE